MPEQQIVEIAKAIGADARIVIMDEPTASLTEREVERLFGVIALLKAHGVGIIYISHRLEEVFAVADRVTVLRDGETVGTCARGDVDRAALIRMMVGRELSAVFPKRAVPLGDVALDVRHLSSSSDRRRRRVADGSRGRDSRPRRARGLRPHGAGGDPLRAHARGRGRDSGARTDRARSRRLPTRSRRDRATCRRTAGSTASCWRCRSREHDPRQPRRGVARAGSSTARASRRRPNTTSSSFRIKTPSVAADVGTLSGGNQQKVALARWLATEPISPHPRRADAGRRRRLQGRDPQPDADARRAGAGDRHDLVRAAGDARA